MKINCYAVFKLLAIFSVLFGAFGFITPMLAIEEIFEDEIPQLETTTPPNEGGDITPLQAIQSFGTIVEGETVERKFKVINKATSPVVLYQVVPDCGCLLSTTPAAITLKPEETLEIPIKFFSRGFSGEISREIRLITSYQPMKEASLFLKGYVESTLKVNPARLIFPDQASTEISKEVSLVIVKKNLKEKLRVRSLSAHIQLYRKSLPKKNSASETFGVKLLPPISVGEFSSAVSVRGLKGSSSLLVPVNARIVGSIFLSSTVLPFGTMGKEKKVTKKITLKLQGENISTPTLEFSSDFLKASVVPEGKTQGFYRMEVTVDAAKVTEKKFAEQIEVHSGKETAILKVIGYKS
jgi:hypothetical protein